ncbi:MAG TPA: UDP-N-acetylmuramate dehydrogenase [Burkholderiaceae bacterium]|nr:UDP-N-acetylmuramate dehydrogenase [Burkholderiaceae bacterium]
MTLQTQEPASLKALNSFGVEARARRLLALDDAADVDEALAAIADDPRVLVLGGGSNLLLANDFDGTVLRVGLHGRRIVEREAAGRPALVEAAAGENWHDFVCWTLDQGLAGLENLSLIPGTVGASPIQNIGAYGIEMRSRFDSLLAVHRRSGERRRFEAAACRFGYRDSVFKHADGRDWLILSVRFRLARASDHAPVLDYGELREELAAFASPTPLNVARAVIAIRRRKLPDPAQLGNAGSFFRNPVVGHAQAEALAERHPGLPRYAVDTPHNTNDAGAEVKLSAAWLIDQCGWKGYRDGDAGVHARHALVLVNHGSATGAQLLALAERIAGSVRERFGVLLEPEPTIVR